MASYFCLGKGTSLEYTVALSDELQFTLFHFYAH
jgi:hypothetical protein